MTFLLTEELADAIVSALENQERRFVVDAEKEALSDAASVEADEVRYYALPEWDSAAGFTLREAFAASVYAPLVRAELQDALHSGRGVFRNFKTVLKKFPEVEKRWHRFKNKKLREYIGGWYNDLREIWGLEKLDHIVEEYDDLLRNDFTFQAHDSARDADRILHSVCVCGFCSALPDDTDRNEIENAAGELWRHLFAFGESVRQTGFICRTPDGDFAGCITAADISSRTETTAVLTSFFVPESYRGLGIGSELFSLCLADLQKRGKRYVVTANTIIPDSLVALFERNGFRKTGSGFAAKIQ